MTSRQTFLFKGPAIALRIAFTAQGATLLTKTNRLDLTVFLVGSLPSCPWPRNCIVDEISCSAQVALRDLSPAWRLGSRSQIMQTREWRRRGARTYSLARSDDLRQPFDSVVACFDHKRGHVFHVAGRFFQLLEFLGSKKKSRQQLLTVRAVDLLIQEVSNVVAHGLPDVLSDLLHCSQKR